jgi:sugar phosphate isomerase/epimerase
MTTDRLAPDRRDFLRAGTAALGLAALPAAALAADKDPFAGFKVGVQSYTFREFDTEPALQRIRDLGLHYVELFQKHAPLTTDKDKVNALQKLCKEYDVWPAAWGVQGFTKDHDANRKTFEFGKLLGIKMFSASPDPDAFDSLDKLCEEYKIAIGIHPHGPVGGGRLDRWFSADVIHKAVKDHHPLLGSCLDTGHLIRAAQLGKHLDPAEQVRVMGDRNFGLHFKDHDNERMTDVILGKGVLDVAAVLKALRDVKFKGAISIEYEANPNDPSADMKENVAAVKAAVSKLG